MAKKSRKKIKNTPPETPEQREAGRHARNRAFVETLAAELGYAPKPNKRPTHVDVVNAINNPQPIVVKRRRSAKTVVVETD